VLEQDGSRVLATDEMLYQWLLQAEPKVKDTFSLDQDDSD